MPTCSHSGGQAGREHEGSPRIHLPSSGNHSQSGSCPEAVRQLVPSHEDGRGVLPH